MPLVVDLDGTLVLTDLLHESAVLAVTRAPIAALRALPALFRGDRAALKRRLAEAGPVDAGSLPLREELVGLLGEEKARGRRLVLATAADELLARPIAARVGLFDEVLASDGVRNLKGEEKRPALVSRFGEKGFDYAADDEGRPARLPERAKGDPGRAGSPPAGRGGEGRHARVRRAARPSGPPPDRPLGDPDPAVGEERPRLRPARHGARLRDPGAPGGRLRVPRARSPRLGRLRPERPRGPRCGPAAPLEAEETPRERGPLHPRGARARPAAPRGLSRVRARSPGRAPGSCSRPTSRRRRSTRSP